jgi:tetratricopeptide (TPR) repeat protein
MRIIHRLFFAIVFSIPLYAESYDYGDQKSVTLVTKAWAALEVKNWEAVEAYTEKCITLYSKAAHQQQSELTSLPSAVIAHSYWALNDVATSHFIKAKAFQSQKKFDLAEKNAKIIINEFSYAQSWDPKGQLFWSVMNGANDIILMLNNPDVEIEEYTSEYLVRKAWETLGSNKFDAVVIYANKCIALYEQEAQKQQESLTSYAPKDQVFNYWALNDVGTAYFILGEVYFKKQHWKEAVEAYRTCVDKYLYAQCWDPNGEGWFWKPSVAARGKLNKILAEQVIS